MTHRGFAANAEARIRLQVPREERLKEADFVVDNSGDLAHLDGEVAGSGSGWWPPAKERRAHASHAWSVTPPG